MSVAEMVVALANHGYNLAGRASKIISDALRWELARERVQRLRRGVYRHRSAPTSTARRIRIFAAACRTWLVATRRTQQPKRAPKQDEGPLRLQPLAWPQPHTRTPPEPQPQAKTQAQPRTATEAEAATESSEDLGPPSPPWEHLGWLWAS